MGKILRYWSKMQAIWLNIDYSQLKTELLIDRPLERQDPFYMGGGGDIDSSTRHWGKVLGLHEEYTPLIWTVF